jgi:uncharacterized RDD family membrane protein YckC
MSQPAAAPGPLASWGDRVVATLIDAAALLVGYIVVFILSAIIGLVSDTLGGVVLVLGYLVLSVYSFYLGFLEGETGQSPGKAMTGLKVVRATDGQLIGGGMGIVRKLAHFLDGICFIGYLFPLFDPMKQTFADKIMTTVVLRDQPKRGFNIDLYRPPGMAKASPPAVATTPPPPPPPPPLDQPPPIS